MTHLTTPKTLEDIAKQTTDEKTLRMLKEYPTLSEDQKVLEYVARGYNINGFSPERHTAILINLSDNRIAFYDTRLRKAREMPYRIQQKPY